jgi:hypothetical protein
MRGALNILVLFIIGAMLADAIANPTGTTSLLNGFGAIWKTGINGVLGKPS